MALNFAGIGRTPQFAIGTSLILRWELCCDAKKNPALTYNIVSGVAREATYLET